MIAVHTKYETGLWRFVEKHRPVIDSCLEKNLPLAPALIDTKFNEAVRYAAFPGGKRLRPVLTLLSAELFGGKAKNFLNAATAVEFIHTSSLIFDDMPAMDDSAERRGKSSLHEKFGNGLSTLVAIGFLNQAYKLAMLDAGGERRRSADAVLEIVDCVGPAGMIGGQSVDLKLREVVECNICSANIAGGVLNLKTSSLIRLALRLGAILSGAREEQLETLSLFAESLGQAYQISDDIIDLSQDTAPNGKAFSVNITDSPEQSLSAAARLAKTILTDNFAASEARDHLCELVEYVARRKE
ncbi:MAG: polyprenyl synthetase family protein [Chloracidobacterium sp.]|nr:polyprenyl synthetase family protein [Chloracidobacterium sp.]